MMRTIFSILFLIDGLLIALGALGHGSNWPHMAQQFSAASADALAVTAAVWYFVSGCMVVFGITIARTWWRARRGGADFFFSDTIAVFYIAVGIVSVMYTHRPFFWVFTALGAGLLIFSFPLRGRR